MFDEPLPPDLRQVEQEVISLMRFNPPAEIGHRIIGAMRGTAARADGREVEIRTVPGW